MAAAGLPPVPELGLSLAALRSFCAQHAGESVACTDQSGACASLPFVQLTTAQVCFGVVMPATAAAGATTCPRRLWCVEGRKEALASGRLSPF